MKGRRGNSSIIESEILIYQTDDGQTKIDVKLEDETVWLTQTQLCDLYQTSKSNISEHIKHIFEEGELEENAVVRKFRTTAAFFKMVQNKLHYAAHGHTAAEVIYERADASQPFMGLKVFFGDFPVLKDISIAKNYLNDEELKILNNIVSGYFDFAEIQAMRHNPMYMEDYVEQLDNVLKTTGEKVLQGAGTISHAQAMEKAKAEYRRYREQTLSPVEEEYLKTIKQLGKISKAEAEKQEDALKEVLSDRQNRLVVSTIILSMGIGIGGGLIASAYVRVPQ